MSEALDPADRRIVKGRRAILLEADFPKIICLCGSTRFKLAFNTVSLQLTLAGYIVLSVGSFMHSDDELEITKGQKDDLDRLHKKKIDLADGVLVLNLDNYIGDSTRSEIEYAQKIGRPWAFACGSNGKLPEDAAQVVAGLFK